MATRHFSTGLPSFDNYIGGLAPGESILSFVSDSHILRPVFSSAAASAAETRRPLLYLAVHGPLAPILSAHPRLKTVSLIDVKRGRQAVLRAVSRSVALAGRGSWIILDDLADWKELLGSESRAADLFSTVLRLSERRGAVLMSTALRSAFSPERLGDLKDAATVSLDVVARQGDPYCVLLSRKGKYLPRSVVPLRMRKSDLIRTTAAVEERPSAEAASEAGLEEEHPLSVYAAIASEKSFQSAPEALTLFEVEGDFHVGNARMEELLGYAAEELEVLNPLNVVVEKFRLLRFLRQLRRKKRDSVLLTIRRKDGRQFPAEFVVSHLSGLLFVGSVTDLSARNRELARVTKREEEYRLMIDGLPVAVAAIAGGRIYYANKAFGAQFGLAQAEAAEGQPIRNFISTEAIRAYHRILRARPAEGGSGAFEGICRRADGGEMHCRVNVGRTTLDGKEVEHLLFLDVSKEKTATGALVASEERFRSLIESSPQAAAVVDNGAVAYVNQAFLSAFGIEEPEKFVGADISTIVEAERREEFLSLIRKPAKGAGRAVRVQSRAKDGTVSDFDVSVIDRPGGAGQRLLFFRNVTEEVRTKNELQERLDEIALLDELVPDLPEVSHLRKLHQALVVRIMEALEWEGGAIYLPEKQGASFSLVYHRSMPEALSHKIPSLELSEGIGGYLSKTQQAHVFSVERYPSYLPYRHAVRETGLAQIGFIPLLAGERLVGAMILWTKKGESNLPRREGFLTALGRQAGRVLANAVAYDAMREALEHSRSLIESSADVLYSATPAGKMLTVNDAVERLTGYTPKEFLRTPSLWLKLVHPDDKKILLERTAKIREAGERSTDEYRLLPRGKAEYRWVRDGIRIEGSGEGMRILGTVSDITPLRAAVAAYRADAAQKSGVLSSLQEGVVVLDRNLRCLQWNPMMAAMTGIRREAAVGKGIRDILPGTNPDEVERLLRRVLGGESVTTGEMLPATERSKVPAVLWAKCSPLRNEKGEIEGVVCLIADVSEQKTLESEMRESEQVLRNVIDTMGDILIITDLRGTILQVNRAFLRVLGYTRAEAVRHEFPYPWLLESEMGRFVLWIASLRERNWLHDFDMTWRANDGRLIPMSLSTTLLRNSLGEPIAMLNIARDITDRVKLTRDLESRNRQIEMINRIISKANQTMDFDEIFTAVAKEIKSLAAADLISVLVADEGGESASVHSLTGKSVFWKGKSVVARYPVASRAMDSGAPVIVTDINAEPDLRPHDALHKNLRSQISVPIRLKEKVLGTLDVGSREPHTFSDETAGILDPIAQQIGSIVDRIRLFNQVSEDADYIHNLLDSIDSVVYTVDSQLRIREVNKAWYEFMRDFDGGRRQEFHGLPLFDVLPDERLKITYQNVVDQVLDGSMRIFSQEFVQHSSAGDRTYQLTINPMVTDRKVTGLVFTHTDISALKRTEAELKRSNEQLLALNEISTLISVSLDLREMLRSAIPLLVGTIGAGAAIVYLRDPAGEELQCVFHLGFQSAVPETVLHLQLDQSATGKAIGLKTPLYIEERAPDDARILALNREVLRTMGLQAMAAIPLLSKDTVLGALDIFYPSAHQFSAQERQVLTLVGNQLGAAIENTQLYAQLRAQVERLTVLYELSEQLTSTLNVEEIFRLASEHLRRVIPFTRFSIEFTDRESGTITPVFCVERQEGAELLIPVTHQPSPLDASSPHAAVVAGKRSQRSADGRAMYIPMLSKEAILGIMTIEAGGDADFSEPHLRLLESIANLTAIALEKGKLYEETLQKSIEIERRNKELDDFTYVVSHDLKEPLISVEGFSKILQADYSGIIQDEGKEYLDSIVGATTRMKGLIDDLLLLSRVSRPAESYRQVPIREILKQVLTDMEFTVRHRGVKFVMPEHLPEVFCNATQIGIVFRNLIGNAVKFNTSPEPVVEVGFQIAENNSYLFWVRDNGIGIEKEFHEKIFVIFQRLHRREEYEGSGAGLAIVKKIVELHKGKIWVESAPGQGSTFFFTLPQAHAA